MSKQEAAQVKTFTKWINNELSKADYIGGPVQPVQGLADDLRNGITLIHLVAATTGQPIPRFDKKCKMDIQMCNNVGIALDMVKDAKIKLLGVGSQDIVDRDRKAILALLWAIIYAQMQGAIQGAGEKSSGKEGLLLWVSRATSGFEDVPDIKNFRGCWSNGNALAALIAKHRPDLLDYEAAVKLPAGERIEKCISVAAEQLGIPALIDASDMEEALDEKSTMTYISEYFKCFSRQQSADQGKKRIARFIEAQRAIDGLVFDYEHRARGVATFVAEQLSRISGLAAVEELVPAQQQLDAENSFRKGALAAQRLKLSTLEPTLGSLQTALCYNGRPAYEPAAELGVEAINAKWAELEEASANAQDAARKAYRVARERVGQSYVELTNTVHGELAALADALRALQGDDPEQLLAELDPLKEKVDAAEKGLAAMRAAAEELAHARVNTDDIAGLEHSADDLEFRHRSLAEAVDRKRKFLDGQLQQKRGSAVSEDKKREIHETFRHFDKNESGTLTRGEFLGALKGLGRDYSDEEATALFNKHKDKKSAEMTIDEFSVFMTGLETITITPADILDSVGSLLGKGGVTKEAIAEELGPEAAEYFAAMVPASPGGGLDFKQYVQGVFAKTVAPPAPPPGHASSPLQPRRARAQSQRGVAAQISFADVDPPSDDDGGGAASPGGPATSPGAVERVDSGSSQGLRGTMDGGGVLQGRVAAARRRPSPPPERPRAGGGDGS